MKVVIKEVHTEDWKAVYLNDKLLSDGHRVEIEEICEGLQSLINKHGSIDSIKGEYYCLDGFEYEFPENFDDITKEGLWLMNTNPWQ